MKRRGDVAGDIRMVMMLTRYDDMRGCAGMVLGGGPQEGLHFPAALACGWGHVTSSHQWVERSDVSVTSGLR